VAAYAQCSSRYRVDTQVVGYFATLVALCTPCHTSAGQAGCSVQLKWCSSSSGNTVSPSRFVKSCQLGSSGIVQQGRVGSTVVTAVEL
jgi:hypothetical protein